MFDWFVVCAADLPFLCSFLPFRGDTGAWAAYLQNYFEHLEILCYTNRRYYYFKKTISKFFYMFKCKYSMTLVKTSRAVILMLIHLLIAM